MAGPNPTYNVTLHHLAPGAAGAGLAYPDEQLNGVPLTQLREMLYALAEVASRLTIYEPSTPEIRIKTERESFVVRTRYRRLCFVGYESVLRGEDHSVAYILTTITGTAETAKVPEPRPERPSATPTAAAAEVSADAGRIPKWLKIAVMAVIIIGCNGTAAWLLLRPPTTLTPKSIRMPLPESAALLSRAAGEYRTGSGEGDRRIIIEATGTARFAKFGPNQAVIQPSTKPIYGAIVEGQPALMTADAAITLKDADTIVYFGNTYKRHNP